MPKGDLVLAKVAEAEEKTTGGILLPGSAQVRRALQDAPCAHVSNLPAWAAIPHATGCGRAAAPWKGAGPLI